MVDISRVLQRFRELKEAREESMELDEMPRDVHLISLRRQRNAQLIEEEKKQLKRDIKKYVEKENNQLWGWKKKPGKMYGKFNKCKVLNDKKPVLKIGNNFKKKYPKII